MPMQWSVPFIHLISLLTLGDSIALPNVNQPTGCLTKSHAVSYSVLFLFVFKSSCPGTCAGIADGLISVPVRSCPPSQRGTEGMFGCVFQMASIL